MKILSLFDGMACGLISFKELGWLIERYVAYEIDKYAIQTATHNFPEIEEKGDVFTADFTQYKGFDFVIGGSPCTFWSIAQKKNRETTPDGTGGKLFSQFERAVIEAKPKYFIYENNKSMSNTIRDYISSRFGFEPICINSSKVSAQNRQRLYWVGKRNPDGTYSKVNVQQPEDRGILLKDILDITGSKPLSEKEIDYMLRTPKTGFDGRWNFAVKPGEKDKSGCIVANISKGVPYNVCCEPVNVNSDGKAQVLKSQYYKSSTANFFNDKQKGMQYAATGVAEPVCVAQRGRYTDTGNRAVKGNGPVEQFYEARTDGKTNAITTVQKDNAVCEPVRVGCMPSPDGTVKNSQAFRVYSTEGKAVTQSACGGGAGGKTGLYAVPLEPMLVKEATKKGYTEIEQGDCVDMTQPNSKTRRGRSMKDKCNCLTTSPQYYQYFAVVCEWDENGNPTKAISSADGKLYTVYEVKDGQITIKEKQYPIKLVDGFYIIRKLTVKECMRLQTVPEWYEFPVSNTQAYKMLGNGWTCAVIEHLITACLQ